MTASTRRELRSAATSTSTTAIDLIRALTDARPIKPTSTRCLSARRPNPGRGSTYRRGNSVQTTAATSRSPAPITDNITTATNRNHDNSANPLNPAPIASSGIGIHKLRTQLRYGGHELPEFLHSDHRRDAGKSRRGRE